MDINKRDYPSYVDLLPAQFENAEKLKAFLSIFLNESQEFYNELYKLFEVGLDLENATGYQLDILGKLVNEYRNKRDDDEYREAIKFSQFIANSSGTIPELIKFLNQITNSNTTRLFEHYPATICMEIDGDTPTKDNLIAVDQSAMAGVDVHSIIHSPDGIALRPVSVNNAYDNYNGSVFTEVTDTEDPVYYAQRPSTDIYVSSVSLAGRPYMVAGHPRAVATGLTVIDDTIDKGKHPEVYTRENL